jgi:acetylglutamate kinase
MAGSGSTIGSSLMTPSGDVTFLKLGGELLEPGEGLDAMLASIAALAGRGPPALLHGGGRQIDPHNAPPRVNKKSL